MIKALNHFKRAFSSFPNFEAKENLLKLLKQEIKVEKSSYKFEELLIEYLKRARYSIEDSSSSKFINISKILENGKVEVKFEAEQYNLGLHESTENEENKEDDSQYEKEKDSYKYSVPFYMSFLKENEKITFRCFSTDFNLQIARIYYQKTDEENAALDLSKYKGPIFGTLEKKLQEVLVEYLENLGMEEDLLIFITRISEDKKKRLFIGWLNKVHKLLS